MSRDANPQQQGLLSNYIYIQNEHTGAYIR